MAAEYKSANIYINEATDLRDKISRINNVINALLDVALKAASTENITEYQLDDGQTKIRTMYRGTKAVFEAINDFERLKQMYINRLMGRAIRLVDSQNFIK